MKIITSIVSSFLEILQTHYSLYVGVSSGSGYHYVCDHVHAMLDPCSPGKPEIDTHRLACVGRMVLHIGMVHLLDQSAVHCDGSSVRRGDAK